MNVKRFVASNVQEARKMVKREMGADAVILDTRVLASAVNGKENARQKVEITAAVDYEAPAGRSYGNGTAGSSSPSLARWRRMEKVPWLLSYRINRQQEKLSISFGWWVGRESFESRKLKPWSPVFVPRCRPMF